MYHTFSHLETQGSEVSVVLDVIHRQDAEEEDPAEDRVLGVPASIVWEVVQFEVHSTLVL